MLLIRAGRVSVARHALETALSQARMSGPLIVAYTMYACIICTIIVTTTQHQPRATAITYFTKLGGEKLCSRTRMALYVPKKIARLCDSFHARTSYDGTRERFEREHDRGTTDRSMSVARLAERTHLALGGIVARSCTNARWMPKIRRPLATHTRAQISLSVAHDVSHAYSETRTFPNVSIGGMSACLRSQLTR